MAQGREHTGGEPRLSGHVVIGELIRNMELGRFEMAYTVLLPCVFTIYLNPDDYATLRGVFPFVIEDARKAIKARIDEWNRGAASNGRKRTPAKEHKIAARDWDFEFLPDPEVPPGDVEIHSELSEAPPSGFRGTRTTLIGREPSVTHRLAHRASAADTSSPISSGPVSSGEIYAAIQFEDARGPQTYFVTQNQVLIGRGDGEAGSVDLALQATDEISRHHLLIRRDPATGLFSAVDASTNGTWVNGKRLPKGAAGPLPSRAQIGLGEVLTLHFEARA